MHYAYLSYVTSKVDHGYNTLQKRNVCMSVKLNIDIDDKKLILKKFIG